MRGGKSFCLYLSAETLFKLYPPKLTEAVAQIHVCRQKDFAFTYFPLHCIDSLAKLFSVQTCSDLLNFSLCLPLTDTLRVPRNVSV